MTPLLSFESHIKAKTVKKQAKDHSRAKFLFQEAGQNYAVITELEKKMAPDDRNANLYAKACYDIIMETTRGLMSLEGYHASGLRAHEAEVAYLRVLGFNDHDVQFADQMRFFRNSILYRGTILDEEYARNVLAFTRRVYPQLKSISEKRHG